LDSSTPLSRAAVAAGARSVIQPSAPERYRVQFTIGQDTHDKLRRLQALMRREIPTGDVAAIFDQAVNVLLERVERAKLGARSKVRKKTPAGRENGAYENRIRFKTDDLAGSEAGVDATGRANTDEAGASTGETSRASTEDTSGASSMDRANTGATMRLEPSRHVPNRVKRAVWWRDRAQCAFVSALGHRCTQRAFLEIHHIQPYALDGPSTVENLSLRCRRHNAYEAELVFGTRRVATAMDGP
jgi:hypothetical protein